MSDREDAARFYGIQMLYEDAAIPDATPGSAEVSFADDALHVTVESRSRGRLSIGYLRNETLAAAAAVMTDAQVDAWLEHKRNMKAHGFDLVVPYAFELQETYRSKPQRRKAAGMAAKVARAREL